MILLHLHKRKVARVNTAATYTKLIPYKAQACLKTTITEFALLGAGKPQDYSAAKVKGLEKTREL